MNERRSLPPHEDELSLALLRSADHDEPSAAAYSKVAAALGVSAAVGLGASVPAQAVLASSGVSASSAARWSGSLFAKGALVGLSSVLLVAGGVALLRHHSAALQAGSVAARTASVAPNSMPLPNSVPAPNGAPSASSPVRALANVVAAPTPKLSLSASPVAPSLVKSALGPNAASVSAGSTARLPRKSSLPEQVLSLDRARVALNSGDAGAALAEIAHYRSAWPRGVFLTEASVLEIEALAKRGEIVLAGMRAQAFVTAHPDCPQAERLRALIPGASR